MIVYDEIHYIRDPERGVVWEESIVLMPRTARLVFLSATIPNAAEFAAWVAQARLPRQRACSRLHVHQAVALRAMQLHVLAPPYRRFLCSTAACNALVHARSEQMTGRHRVIPCLTSHGHECRHSKLEHIHSLI